MSPLTLLHRIASTHHWLGAIFAYRRGDYRKALERYDRISKGAFPEWRHQAFYATLLVLNDRSSEARAVLERVINEMRLEENLTESERYVLNYCCYYVALIDQIEAEHFRRTAVEASPDKAILQMLPLPRPEGRPDPRNPGLDQTSADAG